MHCVAGPALRPLGEVLVGDHQVCAAIQVGDRLVGDRHSLNSSLLDLVPQDGCSHCAGTHSGVAGEDHVLDAGGGSSVGAAEAAQHGRALALVGFGLGDSCRQVAATSCEVFL